jgi:hypothetical protein
MVARLVEAQPPSTSSLASVVKSAQVLSNKLHRLCGCWLMLSMSAGETVELLVTMSIWNCSSKAPSGCTHSNSRRQGQERTGHA